MYLVLLLLSANVLVQSHENRFSNCLLAIENNSLIFECDTYKVVSSANDKLLNWQEFPMSFTSIKYSSGPSMDLCVAPQRTARVDDLFPSMATYCNWFDK